MAHKMDDKEMSNDLISRRNTGYTFKAEERGGRRDEA